MKATTIFCIMTVVGCVLVAAVILSLSYFFTVYS